MATPRREALKAVEAYRELKRERNAIDFGDQIAFAVELLRTRPEVLERLRAQLRVVLTAPDLERNDPRRGADEERFSTLAAKGRRRVEFHKREFPEMRSQQQSKLDLVPNVGLRLRSRLQRHDVAVDELVAEQERRDHLWRVVRLLHAVRLELLDERRKLPGFGPTAA